MRATCWASGKNPQYDALIKQADSEAKDPAKRMDLYSQAETILLDQVGAAMIAQPKFPLLYKSFFKVPSFAKNKLGVDGPKLGMAYLLQDAYITKEATTRMKAPPA